MPLGGTALNLLTDKDVIGPYRGRVLALQPSLLEPVPEADILKVALRGVKPPEEWKTHERVVRWLMTWNRRQLRRSLPRSKKPVLDVPAEAAIYLTMVKLLVLRQRRALRAMAKKAEAARSACESSVS